jgi:predicted methyltransferase
MNLNEYERLILHNGKTYDGSSPRNFANATLLKKQNVVSNQDYRKYLTNHGNELILKNHISACEETGYCPANYSSSIELPSNKHFFVSVYDNTKPRCYEDSDLKQAYLQSQQKHYKQ